VTEAEWWAATDRDQVVNWLFFDARGTERKFRLYMVACCAPILPLLDDPAYSRCLTVTERCADGRATPEKWLAVSEEGRRKYESAVKIGGSGIIDVVNVARLTCLEIGYEAELHRDRETYLTEDSAPIPLWISWRVDAANGPRLQRPDWPAPIPTESARQIRLLHEIFGPLPFRDVVIAPEWLTSDVAALAWCTYDEKAFDRLPILADALQDAGCDNDEILTHLRSDGPHVRGCWVLDLILGMPWRES
jgi:hypothetical protein